MRKIAKMLLKTSGIVLLCCTVWSLGSAIAAETNSKTLGCHKRDYTFLASKTSFDGKECWDYIRAKSCWGRCDSLEIPDWRFPFKLSYHPVCMHEHTQVRRILLRYCSEDEVPNELRYYEYVEAVTCTCHLCNSSSASCEAPHHKKHLTVTSTASSFSYFPKNITNMRESFRLLD